MLIPLFTVLLCAGIANSQKTDPYPTQLGDIVGLNAGSYSGLGPGKSLFFFLGIPYGVAPIGEKRFLPGEPYGSWDPEELQATGWGERCVQSSRGSSGATGSEDCLFLNVFTPAVAENETMAGRGLSVMVYIHGGGFAVGSGSRYLPTKLLNVDVILVTMSFRLGPLGFLCLHDDAVPGNAGLFDQVLALEWVRDNIFDYGGDPDKVTLFGENSGASSVGLHLVSDVSEGLFQQAILQSGSALSEWSVDRDPLGAGRQLAESAGCDQPDMADLVTCLREVDPIFLHDKFIEQRANSRGATGGFGFSGGMPCVQQAGEETFITQHPQILMKSENFTHVPMMVGANRHDGSFALGLQYFDFLKVNGYVNNETFLARHMLPTMMSSLAIYDTSSATRDHIQEEHLHNATMGNLNSMAGGITDIYGVWLTKEGAWNTAQLQAKFSNTYFYSFDYPSRWTLFYYFIGYDQEMPFSPGISQGTELVYLFTPLYVPFSEEELLMSQKLVHLWTNFAIFGNPTPDESPVDGVASWPPYDPLQQSYLKIDVEASVEQDFTKTYNAAVEDDINSPENLKLAQKLLSDINKMALKHGVQPGEWGW